MSNIIRSNQYAMPKSDCESSVPSAKAPSPVFKTRGAVPDAETEARRIVDEAYKKAKQIMDSAQKISSDEICEARHTISEESEAAKNSGYSDGYAEGLEKGKEEGFSLGHSEGFKKGNEEAEATSRAKLDELCSMIDAVENAKTSVLKSCESGVLKLAKTMAKAILRRELALDEKSMQEIIVSAMEEYRNQTWVRIYVSKQMAGNLMKGDNNIVAALRDISDSVKVISSPEMADDACILETPEQVVDAGIADQLDRLSEGVEQALKPKQGQ